MVRLALAVFSTALLSSACTKPADTGSSTTGSSTASAAPSATPAPEPPLPPAAATPVLAVVTAAPVPVRATDGRTHLAYELQVTNAMGFDVTLDSVVVKDGDRQLLSLDGERLSYRTRTLGGTAPTATFGPAQAGLVWLDVVVDEGAPVPTTLTHTIGVTLSKPAPPLLPANMTEEGVAPVRVSDAKPVEIAPPLRGPKWLDGDSCCDMTAHRMALNPIGGQLWAAERFAIDYVQLSDDDTIYAGDRTKPESYPYFGADIHAVGDGPVVGVMEGLPEQVAGTSPTGLPLEQYGGNHIVQDLGNGNYAFYAHLKTDSVKVKVGDQLTTGQVIANLGNTGNTDAPHLHFHVMSTPDPLRSNGLPFVFKDYELTGQMASMDALDPLLEGKPADLKPNFTARPESGTSPLVLDVMSYAGP
ncbi:M23 family metallopeptidase [Mycolicibacterium arenosum]|uniref:M23 family metallopeptidase n=1 Tax=Mycolicibacterium arenosum TaxID=2952157 RepID=A0ABT1M0I6_9MYCO|nr:M23 family metallopeptidase [Mycolicibacterium sp. CAU 1645]MCP9272375.1 M23 family metallopeptidase [Mycolicibacterium sp. CAU 1645]